MANDSILTSIENQVLTVTINRPEKRNSLTADMMFQLADIIKTVNEDDDVRCVVVTATGDYFGAGFDVSGGGAAFDILGERFDKDSFNKDKVNQVSSGSQIGLSIYNSYKPVIAAINGPAAGVGATMILPMDFRLMSDTAKIGYVFTRRGVVPEAGSSWLLPRVVGLTKASDWLITGRMIDASEALESGLVNSVHKPEDLLSAAYAIARDIVENTSAVSVACTRQLLLRMAGEPDVSLAAAYESVCFGYMASSAEAEEGVMSFLEKRPPQFPGKVSKDMPVVFTWLK
jgi:enoyl-CoA hydratase/carnithine racemase